jgi:phospholipid transport system substrate-binding protein
MRDAANKKRRGFGLNPTLFLRSITSIALTCFVIVGAAQAASTPTDRVRAAISDILSVLKNENLDRSMKWREVGRVVDAAFDFRSMSQSILATNWRTATAEEKRQFVEYFSQYLEATYRDKIEAYTNQRVEYLNESVRGERAVVDTVILTDATQIPVSYKLRLNDDEWYAYDVVIEGVSLVNNYRSTFTAIIKSEGMEGLLTDLQGRIERYKTKHGGLPEP